MKILLTGATGFLGKNLKPILEQSYEVIGTNSTWDLTNQSKAEYIVEKHRPDVVIHAAGTVGGIQAGNTYTLCGSVASLPR